MKNTFDDASKDAARTVRSVLIYRMIDIHHLVDIVAVKAKQNSCRMSRVRVNHMLLCAALGGVPRFGRSPLRSSL